MTEAEYKAIIATHEQRDSRDEPEETHHIGEHGCRSFGGKEQQHADAQRGDSAHYGDTERDFGHQARNGVSTHFASAPSVLSLFACSGLLRTPEQKANRTVGGLLQPILVFVRVIGFVVRRLQAQLLHVQPAVGIQVRLQI